MLAERAKARQVEAGGDKKSENYNKSVPQNFGEPIPEKESKHKSESNNEAAKKVGNTNAELVKNNISRLAPTPMLFGVKCGAP